MPDDMKARPGHEAEFRATWKLRDDVANNPLFVGAYEWAATHKLTLSEMGQIGAVLVRREPAAESEQAESHGDMTPAQLSLAAEKAEALRVAKMQGDLHTAREDLTALKAEVRRLLRVIAPHDWPALIDWRTQPGHKAEDYPLIAEALRQPAQDSD